MHDTGCSKLIRFEQTYLVREILGKKDKYKANYSRKISTPLMIIL